MELSANVILKLRDVFMHVGAEGSLEECLDELSALAAHVISAAGCTILLLSEDEVREAGLRDGTGFGALPGRLGSSRNGSAVHAVVRTKPVSTLVRGRHGEMESMFSTIVLHGKIIGVIHASRPQQQLGFSKDDLDLFSILTPIITKSIQVIQLQNILKSRFTQIALARSDETTIRDLISGVMQNPNQIARILAKSFYREMISAGFSFNQIIFAATEVISELSLSLRKHSANHKQRAKQSEADLERLPPASGNGAAEAPQRPGHSIESSIAA